MRHPFSFTPHSPPALFVSAALRRSCLPRLEPAQPRPLRLFLLLLSVVSLLSALARMPPAHGAEILEFNNGAGLPECARSCEILYVAQNECAGKADGMEAVRCFCEREGGSDCADACKDAEDRGRVKGWVDGVCWNVDKASSSETKAPTASPTAEPEDVNKEFQKEEEYRSWWSKNWPFFLIAFLLFALALLIIAFSPPVRRSTKRFFIRRRVRDCALPDVSYNHWTPPLASTLAGPGAPFLGVAGIAGRNTLGARGTSGETSHTVRTYQSTQTARTNLTSGTGASSWLEGEWLGSPNSDGWPSFAYESPAGAASAPAVQLSPSVSGPSTEILADVGLGGGGRAGGTAATGGGFRGSAYIAAEDESADLGTFSTHHSGCLGRPQSWGWQQGRPSYVGAPQNRRHWDEEAWTPKMIGSSVRQESWERRLRAKFDKSKAPADGGGDGGGWLEKLAFWRRAGGADNAGEYGKVGESGL